MKILILSNYANGLYLFRKELLGAFREKGYETRVSVPPDENCRKIKELGCPVIPTEFNRRGNNPVQDLKLFFKYWKLLGEYRPDVVLTYTIKPNLYGGLACRLKKLPCIVNVTGLGTALEKQGLLEKILLGFYRVATKKAVCVFFQNQGNREFMQARGIGRKNGRLLPGSGVNLKEHPFSPYPPEEEGIVFLAVLRIMKDKGIGEYLKAAEQIKHKHPDTRFYLAGEYEEETRGVYEPEIQRLAEKGVIRYFGHIDNVPEVMAGSHVIVHPSYHEGLSNVLLEGAACGRPLLACDVPGCRETLQDGITGILFPPESTEGLADAMERILGLTREQRAHMGRKGREYVEKEFDRKKVVSIYFEEIHKGVKENSGII